MRKIITSLIAILISISVFAQIPEKMNYQAVVRDNTDGLVMNTEVGMQVSILQGSESGTAIYSEQHVAMTNANGLVSVSIGSGTTTDNFEAINWANGPYFIKTETDLTGGENYTITGTSQLLSVPYALHTKTAENGLMDGTTPGEMLYWNGTAWVSFAATENDGATLQLIGGIPTWVGETSTTPPTPITNPTTGKIWMDRNLGASQVATSSTDANAYGDLYQWGRRTDGHQSRTSGTTTSLSSSDTPGHSDFIISDNSPYDWRSSQNDNLWQGVSGINNPCPNGYRLPTGAEWETERTSWSSNNAAGSFGSPLKLPVAGYRIRSNGLLHNAGTRGYYWSSSVDAANVRHLYFNSSSADMYSDNRANGYAVRCIKD